MQPLLLHLDQSLREQFHFCERMRALGAREVDALDLGALIRLWTTTSDFEQLRRRLQCQAPPAGPELTFSGSGDFHHVSLLLIERAYQLLPAGQITVLHFDNHPDWVRYLRGAHCGSWAAQATRLEGVAKVITIGPCSKDLNPRRSAQADRRALETGRLEVYPYRHPNGAGENAITRAPWRTVEDMGEDAFVDFALDRISTQSVYVTIDKDVLGSGHASTNWDQGAANPDFIRRFVVALRRRFYIAGADVVGDWSPFKYDGGFGSIALKRAESLLDQPQRRPKRDALQVNERVNLDLLECFLGDAQ